MNKFMPATRHRVFLKLGITGPTGSVKTFSANLLAAGLADGGKIALLDTENKSASLYADKFKFDVLDVSPPFTETKFIEGVWGAVQEGYTVLIIDSFSHSWQGILDYKATLDARGGNSYVNWNKAGAKFNDVLATILQSKIHIIACMRSKMDYILELDVRGKMVPRKVGLAPVMRDGIEYEFTTVFDGDLDHFVTVSKDRTRLFVDQRFQITEETGHKLLAWLNSAPESEPVGTTTEPSVRAPEKPATTTNPAPTPAAESARPVETPRPAATAQPVGASEKFSVQEKLQEALQAVHQDWVTDFLVDRQKIVAGQTVLDAPATYCQDALRRIVEFREAIIKFGQERDEIPV
jgi:AAA domain